MRRAARVLVHTALAVIHTMTQIGREHDDPTFAVHDTVFYCVANMPGAVPNTSTYALTNVTLPYLAELARLGVAEAVRRDPSLALGVNTIAGHVVNDAVSICASNWR
mgnify:CR=1 FL=1